MYHKVVRVVICTLCLKMLYAVLNLTSLSWYLPIPCIGLGHETMVRALCLFVFLCTLWLSNASLYCTLRTSVTIISQESDLNLSWESLSPSIVHFPELDPNLTPALAICVNKALDMWNIYLSFGRLKRALSTYKRCMHYSEYIKPIEERPENGGNPRSENAPTPQPHPVTLIFYLSRSEILFQDSHCHWHVSWTNKRCVYKSVSDCLKYAC